MQPRDDPTPPAAPRAGCAPDENAPPASYRRRGDMDPSQRRGHGPSGRLQAAVGSARAAGTARGHLTSTACGRRSAAPARRAPSGGRAPTTWPSRSSASCCGATRRCPERIGDVVFAATAQVGDQGLTLGRDVALLAGIPQTVPGLALDRMCAGALTAVTVGAGEIAAGAADVVVCGGVEHMGHHPMGAGGRLQPALRRGAADRRVGRGDGADGREPARRLPASSPRTTPTRSPSARSSAPPPPGRTASCARPSCRWPSSPTSGWGVADRDEFLRPDTTLEGLAALPHAVPRRRPGDRRQLRRAHRRRDRGLLASEQRGRRARAAQRLRLVGTRSPASSRT